MPYRTLARFKIQRDALKSRQLVIYLFPNQCEYSLLHDTLWLKDCTLNSPSQEGYYVKQIRKNKEKRRRSIPDSSKEKFSQHLQGMKMPKWPLKQAEKLSVLGDALGHNTTYILHYSECTAPDPTTSFSP